MRWFNLGKDTGGSSVSQGLWKQSVEEEWLARWIINYQKHKPELKIMEIWFVCWMRSVIHLTRSLFCQENSLRFSTAVMFHFKHPVDTCGEIINTLLQPIPILTLHFLPSSGQEIWSTCYTEWLNAWFWCILISQTCSFEGFHILLAMWRNYFALQ